MRFICLAIVCLSFSISAQAKIYKWVDAQGNTHYSQQPPPGQAAKNMELPNYKPSHTQKQLPPAANAMAQGAASIILDAHQKADKLDCAKAVANVRSSIDTMLETGEKNTNSGYMDKNQYDKGAADLMHAKNSATIQDCESAGGNDKDFYLCMSNDANHFLGCVKRYKP